MTTSISSTPVYVVTPFVSNTVLLKSNVIEEDDVDVVSVSSRVAHMSPSSPVSVGIPSNKTLLRGVLHTPLESDTSEQCPVTDDPLSDIAAGFME